MPTLRYCVLLILILAAGWGAGQALSKYWNSDSETQIDAIGDYSALYRRAGQSVVLIGTSTCPHCRSARAFLAKHGVAYRDYVIDQMPDAEQALGERVPALVPVLYVGSRRIIGFQPESYASIFAPRTPKP